MWSIPLFVLVVVLGGLCSPVVAAERVDPPLLDSARHVELTEWLEVHGRSPVDFVVDLFDTCDVVLLGEQHRVRHDVLFVQSVIEPLHRAGVHVLATEFGRREDQGLIDSLLSGAEWNEQLAREIVFRQLVTWGYQEYVDVFRVAWNINHNLSPKDKKFRILALNDSPDWSIIKEQADWNDPTIMKKVWRGGGEKLWADVILDVVRDGEKVVVHCGIHHAFTKYRQPLVGDGQFRGFAAELRCGNHVFNAIGNRAATVYLHAPWNGKQGYDAAVCHPADGVIDALMLADGPKPVGFALNEGPFGELRIRETVYCHGYEDFRLKDFCDGWIYTRPISEFEGVTAIDRWINHENLQRARDLCPNIGLRTATAAIFNEAVARDAEISRRWKHLR